MLKPKGTLEVISVHSPYFTDEELEVQRGTGTCPKSHYSFAAKAGFKTRFSSSQVLCPLLHAAILRKSLL